MRRRSRRSEAALALALALLTSLSAPAARAEWKPSGALTAGLLVLSGSRGDGRPALGGGLAVDLWQSFGALRLGFYGGMHFVGGSDAESMLFTPIASSIAIVLDARRMSFEIRLRAGGYAGAVHERGFVGGLYLGTGVFLDVSLSDRAAIGFGGDLHLLVASDRNSDFASRAFFAPGITLVYRPERRTAPDAD